MLKNILLSLFFTVAVSMASIGSVIAWDYRSDPSTIGAWQQSVGDGLWASGHYQSALAWYRPAAAWNKAVALQRLGDGYANGLGVAKDDVEAYKWYRRSISGSWAQTHPEFHREVEMSMAVVGQRLSVSQLAEANTRAENWKPRPGSPY